MKKLDQIVKDLKSDGFKITKARVQLIRFFLDSLLPLSASDFISEFEKLKMPINKTTIYRELDFLLLNGYIREVEFGEGKKRYELETDSHHHHLICLKCKKIVDVELELDLEKDEKILEKKYSYKIRNHNLEFFGYCPTCKTGV